MRRTPNAETRATCAEMETAWSSFKLALVGASPSKAGAETVLTTSARVLALAQQGTQQLETVSGQPLGRLVNVSGRQRMLSQRMAAMYPGASRGVQSDASEKAVRFSRDEFVKAHALLLAAPETTTANRAQLDMAAHQFDFFDSALRSLKPGNSDAGSQADVFTTSERILQVMDGVTTMYVRLG